MKEIEDWIRVLKRVNNCDKMLSILEEMSENALFKYDLEEIKNKSWVADISIRKWIAHMKECIDTALKLIKEKDD
jgi:hypothetical protein